MPILKWFPPQGQPRTFVLYKPVSTIGRALGNDVVGRRATGWPRRTPRCSSTGATSTSKRSTSRARSSSTARRSGARAWCTATGSRWGTWSSASACSTSRRSLAARGRRDERPSAISETQLHVTHQQLAGLRKLYEFSEKLMTMKDIDQLLESMLDAVIEVTGAEKGLILLNDDAFTADEPAEGERRLRARDLAAQRIRASRNVKREAIAETTGMRDQRQHRAQGDRDRPPRHRERRAYGRAVQDRARACSRCGCRASCARPSSRQGHVQGVLYVGNDRVKGLFERSQLDVLSHLRRRRPASSSRTRCSSTRCAPTRRSSWPS